MAINVDHIAEVSFKQYFLGDTGEAPANGKSRSMTTRSQSRSRTDA